eukprot:jgi/Hompol1/3951/HPOL_003411-RA
MHRSEVESILADAAYYIHVPSTNSSDPDQIVESPDRGAVLYDEMLVFYLVAQMGSAESRPAPSVLSDVALKFVEVQVIATLGELPLPLPPLVSASSSASASASVSAPAAPVAAVRSKAAPSMPSVPSVQSMGPLASAQASGTVTASGAASGSGSGSSGLGLVGRMPAPVPLKQLSEQLLSSYIYVPRIDRHKPLVTASGSHILFPLAVRLDVGRARIARSRMCSVNLTAQLFQVFPKHDEETSLAGVICDPETFDGVNAFAALADDPLFDRIPCATLSNQYKRLTPISAPPYKRTVKTTVTVLPALAVSICTANSSPESTLLSICIERNADFVDDLAIAIDAVHVQMSNAIITPLRETLQLPIELCQTDQLFLLYHAASVEETPTVIHEMLSPSMTLSSRAITPTGSTSNLPADPSLKQTASSANLVASNPPVVSRNSSRLVSISIQMTPRTAGTRHQQIKSAWYAKINVNSDGTIPKIPSMPAFHGQRFEAGKLSLSGQGDNETVKSGLEVSFHVMSRVVLRRIFRVQVLIVNHSTRERNLSLLIPHSTQSTEFGDQISLVEHYVKQGQDEVSIACLESRMDLRPIPPNACQLVNLHYIVIKGQIHKLPAMDVLDRDTGSSTTMTQQLQVSLRPLYGGAIVAPVPQNFVDASQLREVPDHQEVYIDMEGDNSMIVELLDLEDVNDIQAAANVC